MLKYSIVKQIFRVVLFFLLLSNTNSFAIEAVDKIKKESKNIFKTLTRKSLTKPEVINFLNKNVIIFDDNRGDGVVTYYFDDIIYKRYKNLELLSEGYWGFSKTGILIITNGNRKNRWRIQPAKKNTIRIKKKI